MCSLVDRFEVVTDGELEMFEDIGINRIQSQLPQSVSVLAENENADSSVSSGGPAHNTRAVSDRASKQHVSGVVSDCCDDSSGSDSRDTRAAHAAIARRLADAKRERAVASEQTQLMHRKETTRITRPYMSLHKLSEQEKKARKAEQDRLARARYNAKQRGRPAQQVRLPAEVELLLDALDLEQPTPEEKAARKRERRKLEQIRYREKKRAMKAATEC